MLFEYDELHLDYLDYEELSRDRRFGLFMIFVFSLCIIINRFLLLRTNTFILLRFNVKSHNKPLNSQL